MNVQADKLLWKNKLRLMKGLLRHIWQGAAGLMTAAVILLCQFLSVVSEDGFCTAVSQQGTWYVLLAVSAFNFFRIFLNQSPVFRIDGASLLLTFNTIYFQKLLRRRMWLSAVTAVLLSTMISWVLTGFRFNDVFGLTSTLLILYICACAFLSWIFYHGKRHLRAAVFLNFALCTAMLLSKTWLSAGGLAALLCGLAVYGNGFLKLDLVKYSRRLQFLDASLAAVDSPVGHRKRRLLDHELCRYAESEA